MTNQNTLQLYPSSWLYNAGVIGFLRILEPIDKKSVEEFINNKTENTISIPPNSEDMLLNKWKELSIEPKKNTTVTSQENEQGISEGLAESQEDTSLATQEDEKGVSGDRPKSKKDTSSLYGWQGAYYANQTSDSIKNKIALLTRKETSENKNKTKTRKSLPEYSCIFCTNKVKVGKTNATFLNQSFGKLLLGSEKTFGNMYWNHVAHDFVCEKCEFIIMCHHLAFTKLSDKSEIFINAPSFQIMYYLNNFTQEIFGSSPIQDARSKREILAMSVIEYAAKIQANLASWVGMNIEIISRHGDKIEFFSLPYEVTKLLADRRIAAILSQIGEYSILNLVLDQDFSSLMEMGYRLLRIGLIPYQDRGKNEKDFVNQILQLEKNRRNPVLVAQQIFQLSAYIHEKHKTNAYGYHKH